MKRVEKNVQKGIEWVYLYLSANFHSDALLIWVSKWPHWKVGFWWISNHPAIFSTIPWMAMRGSVPSLRCAPPQRQHESLVPVRVAIAARRWEVARARSARRHRPRTGAPPPRASHEHRSCTPNPQSPRENVRPVFCIDCTIRGTP